VTKLLNYFLLNNKRLGGSTFFQDVVDLLFLIVHWKYLGIYLSLKTPSENGQVIYQKKTKRIIFYKNLIELSELPEDSSF